MNNPQNHHWLKGNLPTWIATGLLAVLSFFVVREFYRNDRLEMESRDKAIRLAVVEEQVKELKRGNDAVLGELKAIHTWLMKGNK